MQNMSNKIDLLLDCNFLLNKLVFTLHKEKRLYIDLSEELKDMFKSLYNLANFNQVHIIADSMMSSWRKKIYPDYKSTRKKDTNIDWDYVFKAYGDFLESQKNIAKKYKIYRSDGIEADDFIAKIIQRNNKKGISNFIISNDHDIKQFIFYDKTYNTINLMSNEIKSKNQKVFLPFDYKVYLTLNLRQHYI